MLAILLLLSAQDPAPAEPPAPAPVSAERLCADFVRQLARAPAVHLVAEAELLSPDPDDPELVRAWRLEAEVWMAKGARSRAVVRWSEAAGGDPASQGEGAAGAEPGTQVTVSDGERACSWFEGSGELRCQPLARKVFVPYPLPELFAVFDGGAGEPLPRIADAQGFQWSERLGPLPAVVLIDEESEEPQPVTWISFRPESGLPAGACVLYPEESGGDTLRLYVRSLELLEELPEGVAFAPPAGLRERAPAAPGGD